MKGIVLAGGRGTRLYPATKGVSKHLVPVYDKPVIFYSLSVLMLAGIQEILIITTPEDQSNFKRVLGDGGQFGIRLNYAVQPKPEGLAQAFIIGEEFVGSDSVSLVLGDNLFYGRGFSKLLFHAAKNSVGASIFGYEVKDPHRFGVVEFDSQMHVISVEEKPVKPKSNLAIVALYRFKPSIFTALAEIKHGNDELQLTDAIQRLIDRGGKVRAVLMNKNDKVIDVGTAESYLDTFRL